MQVFTCFSKTVSYRLCLNELLICSTTKVIRHYMGLILMILYTIPMISAAVTDAKKRIIPDWTWVAVLLIGGISALFLDTTLISLPERAAGFILSGLILLFIAIRYGGIGGGDIKLIAAMGFCFGLFGVMLILLISTILACIYSIVTKQRSVPLAVFLCIGVYIYFVIILCSGGEYAWRYYWFF